MLEVIVRPGARQVVVIAERDRQIGYCLACRIRDGDKIADLVTGIADGTAMSAAEFCDSKLEADEGWRKRYPEAEIVYLKCPEGLHPMAYARLEAEMRVR